MALTLGSMPPALMDIAATGRSILEVGIYVRCVYPVLIVRKKLFHAFEIAFKNRNRTRSAALILFFNNHIINCRDMSPTTVQQISRIG